MSKKKPKPSPRTAAKRRGRLAKQRAVIDAAKVRETALAAEAAHLEAAKAAREVAKHAENARLNEAAEAARVLEAKSKEPMTLSERIASFFSGW